jgi:hypothetical protein
VGHFMGAKVAIWLKPISSGSLKTTGVCVCG